MEVETDSQPKRNTKAPLAPLSLHCESEESFLVSSLNL